MRRLSGASAALFLCINLAQAQIQRHWARHHDGAAHSDDYGYFNAADGEGNVFVVGSVTNALGALEILTVKYDTFGHEEWSRTYAGAGGGPNFGWQVAVDPAGNAVVAGDSIGAGTDYDILLLEYDTDGALLWERRYDGPASGFDSISAGRTLAIDANGDVLVGGYSAGIGTGLDAVVLKYSTDGTFLWEARHNGTANGTDDAYCIQVDTAGNVYVAGETNNVLTGRDISTTKYSPAGALLWQGQYDGPTNGNDWVYTLDLDGAGNVAVTGLSPGIGTGEDCVTLYYDTNGNLLWANRFDGAASRDDGGMTVRASDQGLVAVTGYVEKKYEFSALTLLYDATGALLWARELDVANSHYGDDTGSECEFDAEGDLFVAGYGWDGPEHGYQVFLVEYSPLGQILYEDAYDGPVHGDEWALGMTLDEAGNIFVSGYTQRGSAHLDTLLLKYGPHTMVLPVENPPLSAEEPPPPAPAWRRAPDASPFPFRPGRFQRLPIPLQKAE